jgi:signal transduction histidine kinase
MDAVELLGFLQTAAFIAVALAAFVQWRRQRTRPATYLVMAFGVIGAALLAVRLVEPAGPVGAMVFDAVVVAGLSAFPWLLALFAWSFEGRQPRPLVAAGLAVPALTAWVTAVSPMVGTGEPRTPQQTTFLLVFLAFWVAMSAIMSWRLWRTGGRHRLVRARMRVMSTGAILITLALFVSAATGPGRPTAVGVSTNLLVLVSAGLFVSGFAPPLPLRLWWRRRGSRQFQRMQVALIGAATPREVAEAITPMLADLLGSGVAVVASDGVVLGWSQLDDHEVADLARQLADSGELPLETTALPLADGWLVVRRTPYTPVFGEDEYELLDAFSLQLRLALERAELYRSEQAAREEAQSVRRELESTLYGLSHDLKSPSLAISGFVDLLPHAESEEERDEMLAHIRASTAYLHQLVEALLEVSRVGRTQTETKPVALEEVVGQVRNRTSVSHPRATVRVEGSLPTVEMNPLRAEQLVENLVANAVQHGGRDDVTVSISAGRAEGCVELIVADDGQGVPAEERDRVFDLFQRGSNSGERGSGVGLGLVRRIAETHGGNVELTESGVGARVVVRLPESVLAAPWEASSRRDPAGSTR